MAENTERKKEPTPLTEEEVDALARKFTASWEGADDSAEAEAASAQGLVQPAIPKPNLKRTMLGMAPAASPVIPKSVEQSADNFDAEDDNPEEQPDASGGIPRQRTLLGIQAPDPAYVKELAESFNATRAETANDSAPNAAEPAAETAVSAPVVEAPIAPYAPGNFPTGTAEPTPAADVLAATSPAVPENQVAAGPALFANVPPNPVTLGPALTPEPVAVTALPTPAVSEEPATPPSAAGPAAAPVADATARAELEPSVATGTAPDGPGLFGWGEPNEGPSSTEVEIDVELPSEPEVVTAQPAAAELQTPLHEEAAAPAPAAEPVASVAASPAEPSPAEGPAPVAQPATETAAYFSEAVRTEPHLPADSAQSYAPPSPPPQSARSATPADEKSIVIGEEPHADAQAQQAAARLAQQADTIPPERPRLAELEVMPDFGQGSRRKTGLFVGLGLVVLVGVGAVVAMSGGNEAETASPKTEVTSESAKPEKAPDDEAAKVKAEPPPSPSDDTAADTGETPDAGTSEDAGPPEPADAEASALPAKPASVTPKPVKQTYRPPAKRAATTKKTSTAPAKAAKPKQPKAPSKTIVRDAPF